MEGQAQKHTRNMEHSVGRADFSEIPLCEQSWGAVKGKPIFFYNWYSLPIKMFLAGVNLNASIHTLQFYIFYD